MEKFGAQILSKSHSGFGSANAAAGSAAERDQCAQDHQKPHLNRIGDIFILYTVIDHVCHNQREQDLHDRFAKHDNRRRDRILLVFANTGSKFLDHTIPSF